MNPARRCVVLMLVVFTSVAGESLAQGSLPVDSAKVATVHHLLIVSGAAAAMLEGFNTMVPAQRAANPQIPAEFLDAFLIRAHATAPHLVDSLIPVYASRFTRAALAALVRFYESPVGRHLAEVPPQIIQQPAAIGRRWGMLLGQEIGDSLRAAGVIH